MSDCTTCPNVVGDSYERDCAFPDCVGGWEQAYIGAADEITRLRAASEDFAKMVLGDEAYDNSPCQAHPFELVFHEIERLRTALAEAEMDAARYRWIRDGSAKDISDIEPWLYETRDELDAAIDAAMAREEG